MRALIRSLTVVAQAVPEICVPSGLRPRPPVPIRQTGALLQDGRPRVRPIDGIMTAGDRDIPGKRASSPRPLVLSLLTDPPVLLARGSAGCVRALHDGWSTSTACPRSGALQAPLGPPLVSWGPASDARVRRGATALPNMGIFSLTPRTPYSGPTPEPRSGLISPHGIDQAQQLPSAQDQTV